MYKTYTHTCNLSARFSTLSPLLQEIEFPIEYLRVPGECFHVLIITYHHLPCPPPTPPNCSSRCHSLVSNSIGSPYSAEHVQLPPVSGHFLVPPQPSESEPAFQGAAQGFTPILKFRKLCPRSSFKGVLSCSPLSQAWTKDFFAPIVFNILN